MPKVGYSGYRRMRSTVLEHDRWSNLGPMATRYDGLTRKMETLLRAARGATGPRKSALLRAFRGLMDERRALKNTIVKAAARGHM